MTEDFWFGKRVLITGGDGFVATHLADTLLRRGAVVTVTVRHSRPLPTADLLDLERTSQGASLRPDIEVTEMLDYGQVQRICNRHQIDTIFHLAASAIVGDAANAPMSTLVNNITPTINLLEAARVNNIPRVVIASTDKSYGDHADVDDPEPLPYREQHALRGLDVYSASKAAADLVAQTYAFQFKLPVLVVRSCNIYGPGDLNFSRLIPRTILRLLAGKSPVINLGNADVLREYVYVSDLAEAYMFLAENIDRHYADPMPVTGRSTYGWSAYNVGSMGDTDLPPSEFDNIQSVKSVISMLQDRLATELVPNTIPKPDNFIEIPDQFLNSQKLHDFGYVPQTSFDKGVEQTVEWYQDNRALLSKLGSRYLD